MCRMAAPALLLTLVTGAPGLLRAQGMIVLPDTMLMQIEPARLPVAGGRGLRGATRFIVPTVLLHLSVDGSYRASSVTLRSAATVRGDYVVTGLKKDFVTELASHVQNDFVARLSATEVNVVTFADVSANPLVAQLAKQPVDSNYGTPVLAVSATRTNYAVIAPTDAQLFSGRTFAKHQQFRELARATGAVVLVPELFFNTPQFARASTPNADQVASAISVRSGMDLTQAALTFVTPAGGVGSITLASALTDLGTAVGDLKELDVAISQTGFATGAADSRTLGQVGLSGLAGAGASGRNAIRQHSLEFAVGETEYSLGVLRGAASFFRGALMVLDRERRQREH
jgi:hypothetical protein